VETPVTTHEKHRHEERTRLIRLRTFSLLLAAAAFPEAVFAGDFARLSVVQWRHDLDVLATELPRIHPNPFHADPIAVFPRSIEEAKRSPADSSAERRVVPEVRKRL
jgi:hypothetical protein